MDEHVAPVLMVVRCVSEVIRLFGKLLVGSLSRKVAMVELLLGLKDGTVYQVDEPP